MREALFPSQTRSFTYLFSLNHHRPQCFSPTAVLEAEDIDLYLRPLRRLISCFEEGSFNKLEMLLPPLFHTLCLIWSRSQYYCRPPRMVLLLQEFCNLLIEKVGAWCRRASTICVRCV